MSTKQTPGVTLAEAHSLPHAVQRHSSETQSHTAYRLIAFSWPPALCCKDAAAVVTLVRTKGEKAELVFQLNSICVQRRKKEKKTVSEMSVNANFPVFFMDRNINALTWKGLNALALESWFE